MKKKENKEGKGFVYWFPRIAGLIFALFLMLFSFDVFGEGYGFWGTILAFLMHSIPSIFLFIIILISWKHEIVGGIVFILFALLYISFAAFRAPNIFIGISWSLIIAGPSLLIGILFLIGWKRKRRD